MRKRNWCVVIAACALAGVFAFWWLWPLLTEEIFFLGIWMPLHESVRVLHEVQENDRHPFAADHPLSQIKPDMTERPLPVSTPTRMQTVTIRQSKFSFPATGDVRIFEKRPLSAMVFGRDCSVAISPAGLHDVVFSLPAQSRAKYAKKPFFHEVDSALRELDELPPFEQLVRILHADAEGMKRSRPLGERVIGLLLLSYKTLFIPADPNTPVRYYRTPDMRCFLVGPEPYETKGWQLPDVDVENPEQLQALPSQAETHPAVRGEEGEMFIAWLSASEGRTLVELSFRYPQADDRAQITADTLEFLGQCRIDED